MGNIQAFISHLTMSPCSLTLSAGDLQLVPDSAIPVPTPASSSLTLASSFSFSLLSFRTSTWTLQDEEQSDGQYANCQVCPGMLRCTSTCPSFSSWADSNAILCSAARALAVRAVTGSLILQGAGGIWSHEGGFKYFHQKLCIFSHPAHLLAWGANLIETLPCRISLNSVPIQMFAFLMMKDAMHIVHACMSLVVHVNILNVNSWDQACLLMSPQPEQAL